ncbi:PLP-dependent aminotransferase family protein [Cognatiluteimonas telluris]|uniref:aminotransferase-like domain-containing protein n=1 Tax=Cognatiluteimonas telluris TaxID=1104775 RepID=UPI001FAF3D8F|nr:PLP-dependent aminotransferase family protein [Lysobacter telluris]
MNFLNEVAADYPLAVSFASGRPAEAFFELDTWLEGIPRYFDHLASRDGRSADEVARLVGQYGRTNGLINDLVAMQLLADDGVRCRAENIVITAGCQEALALCVQALCVQPGDVVLTRNPTYIGITGVATLADVDLVALDEGAGSVAEAIGRAARTLAAQGRRARALYLIPSFDNPTGATLSQTERLAILDVCQRYRIVVLEDNPYGMFRYEGEAAPSMATLDQHGVVVYLGTYSKTLCPAVRIGCAVVPETLFGDAGASRALLDDLGMRKSFVTVNSSQLNQALVGGVLLAEQCSLERLVAPARHHYRIHRDHLLGRLAAEFPNGCGVSWNRPEGGFFLTLELPFAFGQEQVSHCAENYQVIPLPMSFLALDGSQDRRVRMAFSNVSEAQIDAGVSRFADFVRETVAATPG